MRSIIEIFRNFMIILSLRNIINLNLLLMQFKKVLIINEKINPIIINNHLQIEIITIIFKIELRKAD